MTNDAFQLNIRQQEQHNKLSWILTTLTKSWKVMAVVVGVRDLAASCSRLCKSTAATNSGWTRAFRKSGHGISPNPSKSNCGGGDDTGRKVWVWVRVRVRVGRLVKAIHVHSSLSPCSSFHYMLVLHRCLALSFTAYRRREAGKDNAATYVRRHSSAEVLCFADVEDNE
ncbi:hypothetical protein E2C01_043819 [Portunus trituberculatus]|uniref:Uncharacterized protein n=1 Tax=Portunus trituberculatus TaxID=210409 RepID=A0A5B7FRA0_PORTR|nr:hypothetical protein [Portunus trituberculatus]